MMDKILRSLPSIELSIDLKAAILDIICEKIGTKNDYDLFIDDY